MTGWSIASLATRLQAVADTNQRGMLGTRPGSDWFSRMSNDEQEAYLREHPHSSKRLQRRQPGDPQPVSQDREQRGQSVSAHLQPAHEDRTQWPEHIRRLTLPPAWTDVKYSPDPHADLQAIGRDAKGRAQYVYSEAFARSQAAAKFDRIRRLNNEMPQIERQVKRDHASEDPRTREHAQCISLIMRMGLRPGGEGDTGADVRAYGATTLLARHVVRDDHGRLRLRFIGKKGVSLDLPVTDRRIADMLTERTRDKSPDDPLFPRVSAGSMLDYAHGLGTGGHKTKDFRTLRGTRLAHDRVAALPPPSSPAEYKKRMREVAVHVSQHLGNTPSVALAAYISPAVFAPWAHAKPSDKTGPSREGQLLGNTPRDTDDEQEAAASLEERHERTLYVKGRIRALLARAKKAVS